MIVHFFAGSHGRRAIGAVDINPWLHNGTWGYSAGVLTNNPPLAGELLTDGGVETWNTATDLASWTEIVTGGSTLNREAAIFHGGSFSARADIDGAGANAGVQQSVTAALGLWLYLDWWMRSTGGTANAVVNTLAGAGRAPGSTWTNYIDVIRVNSANPPIKFQRAGGASLSFYFDDISVKALTLNQLIALGTTATSLPIVSANATIGMAGTQAGVVACVDSLSNPQNGVWGYHDRANAVMVKLVGGVWTQLISTAATYAAGALIEIRRTATTTFQLWYNGVQRGTDQTVADAGITSNTNYGGFLTYSGNSLANLNVT